MKAIDRLKQGFLNKEYFFSVYQNHIYILNYRNIVEFTNKYIKVGMADFYINVYGLNFKITRKNNIEIEITGTFSKMELSNE